MNEQLSRTVSGIYRLATQYTGDVKEYDFQDMYDVFDFVRSIPYVDDLTSCGEEECLKRPKVTADEGGDCDDKTIFSAAALTLLKIPWRIVTTSYTPDGEMSHVYLLVYDQDQWKPFDATYGHNEIFKARPFSQRIIWSTPGMKYLRNGYATLEGSLGFSPLLILGDIDSFVSSIGDWIQKIPIIGGLFRGATQHVDYNVALAQSQAYGQRAASWYRGLDDQGKQYLYRLSKAFFENHVLSGWGTWWDGALNNDYAIWQAKPQWASEEFRVYYYIGQPFFYFCFKEDATRVKESLQAWYFQPVQELVTTPLSNFVQAHYGESLQQFEQQHQYGAGGGVSPVNQATGGGMGLAALGLLGGLLLLAGGKKRRYA